jgi:hypothetical protein
MTVLRVSDRKAAAVVGLVLTLSLAAALVMAWRHSPSKPPPQRAFYYWKTQWTSSPEVRESLHRNAINQLYLRFFDVGWDEVSKTAEPLAPIEFASPLPDRTKIVPVVYLVNNVFLNIPYAHVEQLTDNVLRKVGALATAQGIHFDEIQIDCDWNDSSRRNYFHFADLLARKLKAQGKTVSSTIRLHQIKYAARTGVPPVNRGMLMFYNFGRIKADSPRSSIFNAEDASRYTDFIESYPLPLDVVLPMFSWSVHSRDGEVLGLLEKLGASDLESLQDFRKLSANRFTATRSFFFHGRYFMKGDLLVIEETTPEVTRQAALLAKRGAGGKRYDTVALFDLDDKHLQKFGTSIIGGILAEF